MQDTSYFAIGTLLVKSHGRSKQDMARSDGEKCIEVWPCMVISVNLLEISFHDLDTGQSLAL